MRMYSEVFFYLTASTGAYIIREAMERLCEVCDESGISHVHIETGRLFSVVVKYCQDKGNTLVLFVPCGPVCSTIVLQIYC